MRTPGKRAGRKNRFPPLVIEDHPDSVEWKEKAISEMMRFADTIGDNNYHPWAELVWPGESISKWTWKSIFEQAKAAINEARDPAKKIADLVAAAEAVR